LVQAQEMIISYVKITKDSLRIYDYHSISHLLKIRGYRHTRLYCYVPYSEIDKNSELKYLKEIGVDVCSLIGEYG
jgi:hypothetical protein